MRLILKIAKRAKELTDLNYFALDELRIKYNLKRNEEKSKMYLRSYMIEQILVHE